MLDGKKRIRRRADRFRASLVGPRHAGRRGVSQVRRQRAELLPMEEAVCRDCDLGDRPFEATRVREYEPEAAGCGPDAGQVHEKKCKPPAKRLVVDHFRVKYGVSARRAVRVTGAAVSSYRYRSRRDPQTALRMRVKELAAARVRYGYRGLHVLLQREDWSANYRHSYRLYYEKACRSSRRHAASGGRAATGSSGLRSEAPTTPGRWISSASGCLTGGRSGSWRASTAIREKLSRHQRGQTSGRTR